MLDSAAFAWARAQARLCLGLAWVGMGPVPGLARPGLGPGPGVARLPRLVFVYLGGLSTPKHSFFVFHAPPSACLH